MRGGHGHRDMLGVLLLIKTLEQALPALLHFDETRLEPLPEFVVLSAPHVGGVPDVVLDELFDLVLPHGPQHVLLDALHSDHEASDVLD